MSRAHGRNHPRAIEPKGYTPELASLTPEQLAEFGKTPERNIPGDDTHLVNYTTKHAHVPVPEKLAEFRGMMAHGVPVSDKTQFSRPEIPGAGHRRTPGQDVAPSHHKPTPVPVYLVEEGAGESPLRTIATDWITIPATGSEPARISGRDKDRKAIGLLVETAATTTNATGGNPVPGTVNSGNAAATTVNFQNPFYYPVKVVIAANGATITNVSVSGATVGTAAGTYYVNVGGYITLTYTVATPTWVWSYNGPAIPSTAVVEGVRISHEVSDLDVGKGALLPAGSAKYAWFDCEDELFAVSADTNVCVLSVVYVYEIPAAGP